MGEHTNVHGIQNPSKGAYLPRRSTKLVRKAPNFRFFLFEAKA
jgi:hypothetical protein